MKEFKINDLHITDYEGNENALILLHAFPLSSKMWKPQIDFFKNQFRVITYDVRGLGKSKSENNQMTMEIFADDLLSIIESLKLNKVFVCGVSMGGYIILRSYIKNPKVFKAIILADTRAERDDNKGLINRSNIITNIKNGKRDEFISEFLPKLVNKKNYENSEIKMLLEEMIKENTDEGICGALLALATRIDSTEYLNTFNVPTLIIVGEYDTLTPLDCSERMFRLIPNSELKIIPNSGHLSNIENSDLFNFYVSEFLSANANLH